MEINSPLNIQNIKNSENITNTLKENYQIIFSNHETLNMHKDLINKAYDREESWTDKTLIINLNQRITEKELLDVYKKKENLSIILVDKKTKKYVSCCNISYDIFEKESEKFKETPFFNIGLFCTDPDLQSKGLGKYIFLLSEKLIKIVANIHSININFDDDKKSSKINEINCIKNLIEKNYSFDKNFFDKIDNYGNEIVDSSIGKKEIDTIIFKVILAKKGLYNFYLKYGYKDSGEKKPLSETFPQDIIIIESYFGVLHKNILEIN